MHKKNSYFLILGLRPLSVFLESPPVSHPVWVSLNYDFLPQARKQEPPWLTAESSSAATTSQGERGFSENSQANCKQ